MANYNGGFLAVSPSVADEFLEAFVTVGNMFLHGEPVVEVKKKAKEEVNEKAKEEVNEEAKEENEEPSCPTPKENEKDYYDEDLPF